MAGGGAGALTCAIFVQQYKADPSFTEAFYFSWAMGYMTASNIARPDRRFAVVNSVSADVMKSRLRDYCDAHPLKRYVDGVEDLYFSLPQAPYPSATPKVPHKSW